MWAATLYARFCPTEDMADLDEAISVLCEAISACSDTYTTTLSCRLSAALLAKFDMTGNLHYLQEAMDRWKDWPQDSANDDIGQAVRLYNFAMSLLHEFWQL